MKKFTRILCLTLVAVMLCAALVSCGGPAKNPDDAKAALKENGYLVMPTDKVITAINIKTGDAIIITYYDDAEAAKEAMDKIDEDRIATMKSTMQVREDQELVGPARSGSMIYFGTKQAVKDAK